MGVSRKSNGKKSDKETQSPVLKLFKDMMQKEKTDPEKINLLKDKQRNKKRKSYSGSRSKTDHRSYDSSSTDKYKANKQAKITVQDIQEERREDHSKDRSRSTGDNQNTVEKKPDDTCSCISCALKKIVGSEYTCVACLLILFSVSVVVAFLLVFKTIPVTEEVTESSVYGDNLVKKIQMMKEKRQLTENYGYDFTEKNRWDDTLINSAGSYSNILGSEYAGNDFKASNALYEADNGMSEDLASVLDNEKMMEGQNSERLKDFFKKLIQTDVQISKLKKAINNKYQVENIKTFTDRFKRSLALNRHRKSILNKNKRSDANGNANGKGVEANKLKYIKNDKRAITTIEPGITGYVIESEKLLIQYEPDKKRNFPKCSHVHESKSHEQHLKHPFYKHSQRIDEMLETYKKPEYKFKTNNDILAAENVMKNKNTKPDSQSKKFNGNNDNISSDETTEVTESVSNDITSDFNYEMENFKPSASIYDVALSVSTFINPMDRTMPKSKLPRNDRVAQRKLLQIEEEEDQEELGYEDLKEVLMDDQEEHDDLDKNVDRKRRNYQENPFNVPDDLNQYKYNSPNTYNPNWKGPLPLYPDELNAMVKQAALKNLYYQLPLNTNDAQIERDKDEKEISDIQYVEDYTDNKYNKLIRMAQAYSDYGVVYNKKEDEKKQDKWTKSNQILKFNNFFNKHRLFGRPKKGSVSEGFRFEIKSGGIPNEHEDLIKTIQKHVKITEHGIHGAHSTTLHPVNTDFEKSFTPSVDHTADFKSTVEINSNSDTSKCTNNPKSIIFTIRKGSRSLKSIVMAEEVNNTVSEVGGIYNSNDTNNNSNVNDGIISFISMMSEWFKTLASLSGEIKNGDYRKSQQNFNVLRTNDTKLKSKNKYLEDNNTEAVLYPSYDSEMVDNIGHRSRVLMSIKENSVKNNSLIKRESPSQEKVDDVIPLALVLASNDSKNIAAIDVNKNKNLQKNRTMVKRSLGDNLVFWNDLYDDDEYGVKLDYINNVRDKHSAHGLKNFIHKSKDWIQEKLKNATRNLKRKFSKRNKSTTKRKISTVKKPMTKCNDTRDPCKGVHRRHERNADTKGESDIKKSFAALTANMKKVCQEAARAVQNTRNVEVRENNKEGAEATSLMQQLVRMMTDLVDIQVQQKTCAKLPADLYNFLDWLTAPSDSNPQVDDLTFKVEDYSDANENKARYEKSTLPNFDVPSLSEDTHQDDRTECLGTIRALQDLIQQYEGMSDEDKSKMTGVKEYLENQLQYLNNKLYGLDETNILKLYDKREIALKRRDSHHNIMNADNANLKEEYLKTKDKRNLRDIYYKALGEAKKATVKPSKEASNKL